MYKAKFLHLLHKAFQDKENVMGTIEEEKFLDSYSKEKSLISQETIMKTTNKFACALVGAAEICQQENIMVNNPYPNPGQHSAQLKNVHIDILD